MSLANDLLGLAKKMVNYKKTDLVNARVRRAISTAYYAVFHFLTEQGSAKLAAHAGVRALVGRAYAHSDMIRAAKAFQSGQLGLPAHLKAPFGEAGPVLPAELVRIAKAFVELQEARHEADYNLSRSFSRADGLLLVTQAENAFADWKSVAADPEHRDACELFLAALLLGERWKK